MSQHQHDYQEARLPNGNIVAVDGGHTYIKRSGDPSDWVEYVLYASDRDELIFERLLWGTRGVFGNEPLRYIRVKDMEPSHAQAVLVAYGKRMDPTRLKAVEQARDNACGRQPD